MGEATFEVPGLETRLLGPADAVALDELHLACADFFEMVEGRPPAAGDGLGLVSDRPEGLSLENKLVFGLFHSGQLIGAIDLLRNYPEQRSWYLGLMVFAPTSRHRGWGGMAFKALRSWIVSQGGQSIRLIVQSQNPRALEFWLQQGFASVGTAIHQGDVKQNEVYQLEQALRPAQP
jgi:GNAT superfamily N-acetyltransferase